MGQIGLKEHQKILMDLLINFSDFCKKNDLEYHLDSGTLLGAVRHNGFIPWDNDIDINMFREDYERFLFIAKRKQGMLTDTMAVEFPEDTIYQYIRIIDTRTTMFEFPSNNPIKTHVYIDLFPKDFLLNDGIISRMVCFKSSIYGYSHWFLKRTRYSWKKSNFFFRFLSKISFVLFKNDNLAFNLQKKFIKKYENRIKNKKPKYVTTLVIGEFNRRTKVSDFDQIVFLRFGEKKFMCPSGYEDYLTVFYGKKYMDLPPIEKRRVHNVEIYVKDEK